MKVTIAALLLTLPCIALALPPEQPGEPQVMELGDLNGPFGVDFDASGNMVIVELPGGRILKWTPNGELQHIGGSGETGYSGDGGPVIEASFDAMHNVAIGPDGSLYISDHRNHAIRRVDRDGIVTTWAGGEAGFAGDGKTVGEAKFNMVMSVSIDPAQKYLLVSDIRNRRIRRITFDSGLVETVAGNGEEGVPADGAVATEVPLVDPRAAAYDAEGNIYVLERRGNALRVVDTSGRIRTVAGNGEQGYADGIGTAATFGSPKHLAIDPAGVVYIADDRNHLVRRFDPGTGEVTTVLGHGEIQLQRPHGVHVHEGWLYVADSMNDRIIRVRLNDGDH